MTRDDIQRLMASYATGSLTDSERKLLYEAALDDQDLFDQLAHEHSLKSLLDEPGARDRLIAKLAPAEGAADSRGGWKRPLAWGLAGTFVLSMSLAALFLTRSGVKTQLAQTQTAQLQRAELQPPAPPAAPAPSSPAAAPINAPQMRDEHSPVANQTSRADKAQKPATGVATDKIEPAGVTQQVESTVRLEKDTSRQDALDVKKKEPKEEARVRASAPPSPVGSAGQLAGQLPLPPPIQPLPFVAGQSAQNQPTPTAPLSLDGVIQNGQTQAQSGAVGGGGRGGGIGPARNVRALPLNGRQVAKSTPPHFAFDYAIEGEDLVFKFAADGYFSLHIVPGGLTIVDSRVTAGSTRRERINSNGTEANIVFSAAPQSTSEGVNLTRTLKADTVEDPAGVRIELLVRFYPPPF